MFTTNNALRKLSQNCSFIRSFILAISIVPLQVLYYSEALPTTARILYRNFTPKRTGNCRYQGPYVAARAGVESTTLRLEVIASTDAPPRPTDNMFSYRFKRTCMENVLWINIQCLSKF